MLRASWVHLIEELTIDVDLRVEITTHDTQLLKLSFSGTPNVASRCSARSATFPVRWSAVSGTRDCGTTRSCSAVAR